MTDPRTPLTLEFTPEYTEPGTQPVVVIEPSFQQPGAVFVGIHPLGPDRVGLHLTAPEARTVRDHMTKLLLEHPADTEIPDKWQKRIDAAAQRAAAGKPRDRFAFRFTFRIGRFEGIIGRGS